MLELGVSDSDYKLSMLRNRSRAIRAFTSKSLPETEAIKSPTSILDKPFFPFRNPFALTRPKSPKLFSPGNPEPKRVQIPPLPPTDFGIKTRNSYLSPTFGYPGSGIYTKDLPVTEMELSEDYTCVISHGPNPRTTHIFDNCVVESYFSVPDNEPKPTPREFP
ncbi:hypothetical protein F3Y22_tig00111693pilonHSYRG00007 [Hibiscus syriacus]|uniref:Uncharacterized protein n=1 Tax=Hibiscus syriacus TaxID=106335 RepID=A0A6A2XHX1_HIBSY|nr:hypothetical protein F3Y22_tig00111693pilonHSYRG00007 [Hibiscus syriacus]